MKITDVFKAKRIAMVRTEVASNQIPYLGRAFFPFDKKAGLDLSWIKGSKGLPVALKPSAFDTVSTLRSREGINIVETELAYFKESMLLKEKDEQEILRVQESTDPYAKDVINHIYNDAETLVEGAEVIPERMVWSLLAPEDGTPRIRLQADNANYEYNYDPNGNWQETNFAELTGSDAWSDPDSDPIKDLDTMATAIEDRCGTRPTLIVTSPTVMNYLKANNKIKGYFLTLHPDMVGFMTESRVRELFVSELKMEVIVYKKRYIDYDGDAQNFFPNTMVSLLPKGALGKTWFGTTPEERTKQQDPSYDCELVEGGIAVAVTRTHDPEHTKTTVAEICLPSWEMMDYCGALKVAETD